MISHVTVSILVLVDAALRQRRTQGGVAIWQVSILVLLDAALRPQIDDATDTLTFEFQSLF